MFLQLFGNFNCSLSMYHKERKLKGSTFLFILYAQRIHLFISTLSLVILVLTGNVFLYYWLPAYALWPVGRISKWQEKWSIQFFVLQDVSEIPIFTQWIIWNWIIILITDQKKKINILITELVPMYVPNMKKASIYLTFFCSNTQWKRSILLQTSNCLAFLTMYRSYFFLQDFDSCNWFHCMYEKWINLQGTNLLFYLFFQFYRIFFLSSWILIFDAFVSYWHLPNAIAGCWWDLQRTSEMQHATFFFLLDVSKFPSFSFVGII